MPLAPFLHEFRETAHHQLTRLARSLGVSCHRGQYQALFSTARASTRRGVVLDTEGKLEYRFHGAGCEFLTPEAVLDFNVYPMLDGANPFAFDAYKFTKFLVSRGLSVNEDVVLDYLCKAASLGVVEKWPARDYFFMMWNEGADDHGTLPTASTTS